MSIFCPADILIPPEENLPKWSVVACDQYTSQRDYWDRVRSHIAEDISTGHLILPEAELGDDLDIRADRIHACMEQYLEDQVFQEYKNAYIYIERTLSDGKIRRGVLGVIDLEAYHYLPDVFPEVRATEKTVMERIPAREKVRDNAVLDMTHILLLADDDQDLIFSQIPKCEELPVVYAFDLMENGGHIVGRLLAGQNAEKLEAGIAAYEDYARRKHGENQKPIIYAVGDGNHSLAAAKACYEKLSIDERMVSECAKRYALVELGNIHDPQQCFEPIHRIVSTDSPDALLQALKEEIGTDTGYSLEWFAGEENGIIPIRVNDADIPVAILQDFLDRYSVENKITIDYIHGGNVLKSLSKEQGNIGFTLSAIEKENFFYYIQQNGYLPRKTFSLGHASEKRYYLETRKL